MAEAALDIWSPDVSVFGSKYLSAATVARTATLVEIPYQPHQWQEWIHEHLRRFSVLVCHRRFGKALDVDTPVPMADGTWTTMGALVAGDRILGSGGRPVTVSMAHPVMHERPCYEVEFDNGEVIVADAEHLWVTTRKQDRHNPVRRADGRRVNAPRPAEARTTAEIAATLRARGEFNHRVQRAGPADYPEQALPIDPYLLGLWLGDGTSRTSAITTIDRETVDYLQAECDANGWRLKVDAHSNAGQAKTYRLNGGFQKTLRGLGVLGNKHIPDVYLRGSVAQRLALLQGLMDSDGSINKLGNYCENTQKSRTLTDNLEALLLSLGMQPRVAAKRAMGRPYYRITFRPTMQVFRLGHKAARYVLEPAHKQHLSIVRCEPVVSRPVRCITVDAADSLYLVGRKYIVTHNTVLAINALIQAASTCKLQDGRYGYVAPFRSQAKDVAWLYLKRYARSLPGFTAYESDLYVEFINAGGFKSRIRLYGADNSDAIRGIYFDGVVLDEVADMSPEVWGEIIRPMLTDRRGFALFIGTPKGINLFSQMYNEAREKMEAGDAEWYADSYPDSRTLLTPADELLSLKGDDTRPGTMTPTQFRQEYECDFSASNEDVLLTIDVVSAAMKQVLTEADFRLAPRVLGIDVARYGGDRSVIARRQGLMTHDLKVFRGADNMTLAGHAAGIIEQWKPDAVFIDAGRGEGVIDRLRQLGYRVTEVNFGGSPLDAHYQNKRAEMWDTMARWVKSGARLPNDQALRTDLCAPTYTYRNAANKFELESKDSMKKRLRISPDLGDALALTFAFPVAAKQHMMLPDGTLMPRPSKRKTWDYDPHARAEEEIARQLGQHQAVTRYTGD